MTKQLKTIEILNPSKSATCSMWRYPESAKIFQHRGMDFDGFRVVRVNLIQIQTFHRSVDEAVTLKQILNAYYIISRYTG